MVILGVYRRHIVTSKRAADVKQNWFQNRDWLLNSTTTPSSGRCKHEVLASFFSTEDAGLGWADDPGSSDSQVPADLLNACFEIERNRQFVADPHLRFRQAVTLQRAKPPGKPSRLDEAPVLPNAPRQ